MTQRVSILGVLLVALVIAGCTKKSNPATTVSSSDAVNSNTTESGAPEVESGDPEPGEAKEILLEPFDPPTLEELESKVTWIDQRVVDPIELRREAEADQKPLVGDQEALAMKNDGPEANKQILSALGRLPSDGEADWNATIVRHLNGDVKSTNPLMQNAVSEAELISLIGFNIFSFDWDLKPLALDEMAVSWQTSDDGLYDKVVLRDDLTWSDGHPITAHDIKFTFQTIMNPEVPIPAVRAGTDEIRWIEAYDDQTVVYFHKKSSPTNIWNVNFPVVPKHIYEESIKEDPTMSGSEYHVKLEQEPVCGGPYVLTKRTQGQEIVVQRRDDWYMKDGKQIRPLRGFKEIRLRVIEDRNTALLALRAGEIEETMIEPASWITDQTNNEEFYSKNTKATGTQWVEFHVVWNLQTPYFSDKRVRKAMAYAFDHDEMLDKLFYGLYEPAMGPFHPTGWMASKNVKPYKQDLDKAEDLLDAAGWEDSDGDGVRDKVINGKKTDFEFTLICSNLQVHTNTAELFKTNLDQIGIICNIRPLEFTVLMEMEIQHKFHAAIGGWGTGTDPDTLINIFGTGENRNYGFYSSKEVDDLFAEGRKEFDPEKRAAIYAKIHELIYDDQPYLWLYYRNSFYGFSKSLRGYRFSPRGPFGYSPGFDSFWKPES